MPSPNLARQLHVRVPGNTTVRIFNMQHQRIKSNLFGIMEKFVDSPGIDILGRKINPFDGCRQIRQGFRGYQ